MGTTTTIGRRLANGALRQHLHRDPAVRQECHEAGGSCNHIDDCCGGLVCCNQGFFLWCWWC